MCSELVSLYAVTIHGRLRREMKSVVTVRILDYGLDAIRDESTFLGDYLRVPVPYRPFSLAVARTVCKPTLYVADAVYASTAVSVSGSGTSRAAPRT